MWELVYTGSIPLNPVAMGRPRSGRGGRMYTPPTSRKYMNTAVQFLEGDMIDFPPVAADIALKIESTFVFKRPQRLSRKKDPVDRIWKTSRSDIDNLEKMLFDVLGEAHIYHDDAQIVCSHSEKFYCSKIENPATHFKIFIWR